MKDLMSVLDFPVLRNPVSDVFNSPWFLKNAALPAANVVDNEKEFKIDLAAPGLSDKDFDIVMEDNNLLIKAEKEVEKKTEKDNYIKTEYNYDSFSRTFYLDEPVDPDKINATYKNGILEVIIPKKDIKTRKNGKHIAVNANNKKSQLA